VRTSIRTAQSAAAAEVQTRSHAAGTG
jgi:hypothetical protein